MSKYYHGTSYSNFLKIIEDGEIKTGIEGLVFLAKTKEEAFKFVVLRYLTEDIVVIELELDDSKIVETFDHDQLFFMARSFGYKGKINTTLATNYWQFPIEDRFKNDN